MFKNYAQEIEFNSPKELISELMRLMEHNWRKIDEMTAFHTMKKYIDTIF